MTVQDLIEKLSRYNKTATIGVYINGMPKEFEICYGTSEGCTPENCDSVDFMVETQHEIYH